MSQHTARRGMHSREKKRAQRIVFGRDNYRCVFCGSSENLTLDHIIPRGAGGGNGLANLQTLCAPCNNAKSREELPLREAARAAGQV